MFGTDRHEDYPPALTGRVRRQDLAQELYTLRVREDRPLDLGVRRSLKGRRHA